MENRTSGPFILKKGPAVDALHIYSEETNVLIFSNPGPNNINENIVCGSRHLYQEEREANALLFAASYDLLKACHEAKLALHSYDALKRMSRADHEYFYGEIMAALKKAEPYKYEKAAK